jgi:TonB family protein
MSAMPLLLESTIKTSLIVLVALAGAALLRRQSAAVRHWVLATAIICSAVVPALGLVVPSWHLPIGAVSSLPPVAPVINAAAQQAQAGLVPRDGTDRGSIVTRGPLLTLFATTAAIWIAGVGISLLILVAGLARLEWIASRARRIDDGPWAELAERISREYGLRRPAALLQSDHPTLLVTWGLIRPRVILPRSAPLWTDGRAQVVLLHELAHIKRRDWLFQMLAEILRSAYWFNPLVWIVCRRLREESEHATDDAVLDRGVAGPEYATHLLDIARAFTCHNRPWLPAAAIARPSSLERRIAAMLSSRANRAPASRPVRLTTMAALFALAVAVASAQGAFATFSGSVFDPTNAVVPDVTMVLTNAQSHAKHEIRSDRNGHFEFVGLPPGEYSLEATLPGFAMLRGTLTLTGENVRRDVTLKIGSLEETISVWESASRPPATRESSQVRVERGAPFEPPPCTAATAGAIGGSIRQPMKLAHVVPQFPPNLSAAKVGGVVVLQAHIGTDGTMGDVQIVSASHPDFGSAAVEAVRRWQFSETLLNCVPVEVAMKVTVNFIVEP